MDRQADTVQLRLQDGALLQPEPAEQQALLAQPAVTVTLGLRPKHLQANLTGPLQMQVEAVETLGSHKLLLGTLAGRAFAAQVPPDYAVAADGIARLSLQPGKLHMFDPTSGQAIRAD